MGLSAGATGCKSTPDKIEVRSEPPFATYTPEPKPDMKVPDLKVKRPDMIEGKSITKPPIEVRVAPPAPPVRPPPKPPKPPTPLPKKPTKNDKAKGGKKKAAKAKAGDKDKT